MLQNSEFQAYMPSYSLNLPYFFLPPYSNFSDVPMFPMENPAFCQLYEFWDQKGIGNLKNEIQMQISEKDEEDQAADQTQVSSKHSQICQKPKKTQTPRFRPTKNNESNISNQAFSFITTQNKSKNILQNFFKNKKKTQLYYEYSKYLSSNRKKYMSKGTLLKLCTLSSSGLEYNQLLKLKTLNILSIKEFESGVCFLILHFLKHKAVPSILTSQKIASNLKKDHIIKVRQILNYIQEFLKDGQRNLDEQHSNF